MITLGDPQTLREPFVAVGNHETGYEGVVAKVACGHRHQTTAAARSCIRAALASPDSPRLDPPARCRIMIGAKRCEVHDARWYPEYAVRCDAAPQSSPDSLRLDPEDPDVVERLARAIGTATDCGHSSCASGRDTSRHLDDALAIAREWKASALPDPEVTK